MNEELKIIISAEIKDIQNKLNQVKKQIGETADSSSNLNKIGTAMSNVAKTVAKVSAAAFATVTAGIVALTKSAIDNYAEYEQLVGGVETLFKDSAGVVQQYAASAYKAAGLSANEYMSTVTSFSASLLQSLGNDTAAAAKYADQAIIDMADNANKMGTSMESIQNAYQGFAKQNYTMLDNLKLGYGGTKEEMERLIADANRVKKANGEMADLSIDSFADVTEAIHIIQTEMGITGTTAEEAASTISGSTAMMKAAWQNLLTGIADDNANFEKLLTDFIESIATFAQNIVPRIETALGGVIKLIEGLAPIIVATIPKLVSTILPEAVSAVTNIITSIADVLPDIVDAIIAVIPQIISAIGGAIPTILECVFNVITSVVNGLATQLPSIVQSVVELIPQIINTVINAIPQMLEAAISLLMAIVDAIPLIIPPLVAALPTIIDNILTTLLGNLPILINAALELFLGIVEAIPMMIPVLVETLPTIIASIVEKLIGAIPEILEAALQLFLAIPEAIMGIFGVTDANLAMLFDSFLSWFGDVSAEFSAWWADIWSGFGEWWSGISADFSAWWGELTAGWGEFWTGVWNGISSWFSDIAAGFSEWWTGIGEGLSGWWDETKQGWSDFWGGVDEKVSAGKEAVVGWFNDMKDGATEKGQELWNNVSEKFTGVKESMSNAMGEAKTYVSGKLDEMQAAYDANGGGIQGIVSAASAGVKSLWSDAVNVMNTATNGKFGEIYNTISSKLNAAWTTVSSILGKIKDKFTSIMNNARDTVKSAIDKIKGFFDFSWELPKIKLPHFSISGSFSLNPPSIPKFSVSWYQHGGVFDAPTLFGFGNGQIGGLGENGAEAVVPLEKNTQWLDRLAEKLAAKQGSTPIVLQVDGKTFAQTTVSSLNELTRQTGTLGLHII